jgi:hypothetical protein
MRNSTWLLVIAFIAVFGFIAWLFVDPVAKDKVLFFASFFAAIIAVMAFGVTVGQKHSPHFIGFGYCTSLGQTEPLKTVDMPNPSEPKNPWKLDIYANNGCKPLMMMGGGKHGYAVHRRDLSLKLPGDLVNIIAKTNPPDLYMLNAPSDSEYYDLRELPRELYNALKQTPGWHDKAKVAVFWDPPNFDAMADWDDKEAMPYKNYARKMNKENFRLQEMIDNLQNANTKMSATHKTAADAYSSRMKQEQEDAEE